MAEEGADILPAGDVPHMDGTVTVARSDVLAIGRPGNGFHNLIITAIGRDSIPRGGIPYTHTLIPGP